MDEKYHPDTADDNRSVITNDIYLAAYLDSLGFSFLGVQGNERRRVSFVFSGRYVERMRNDYKSGIVSVNFRIYKDSLARMRYEKDRNIEQRSYAHGAIEPLAITA